MRFHTTLLYMERNATVSSYMRRYSIYKSIVSRMYFQLILHSLKKFCIYVTSILRITWRFQFKPTQKLLILLYQMFGNIFQIRVTDKIKDLNNQSCTSVKDRRQPWCYTSFTNLHIYTSYKFIQPVPMSYVNNGFTFSKLLKLFLNIDISDSVNQTHRSIYNYISFVSRNDIAIFCGGNWTCFCSKILRSMNVQRSW